MAKTHVPKICFAVTALDMGGIERVTSVIANELASRGNAVTLVRSKPGSRDFYSVRAPYVRLNFKVEYFFFGY